MSATLSHHTKQSSFSIRHNIFYVSAVVAVTCAYAAFLLIAANAAQRGLSSNALWEVVHNVCVPGQSEQHNPKPCLQVDLNRGIEKGFAILRDPRGGTQFLLIPTTRSPASRVQLSVGHTPRTISRTLGKFERTSMRRYT